MFLYRMNSTDASRLPSNKTAGGSPYSIETKIGLIVAYLLIFVIALFGNSVGLYVVCFKSPSRRIAVLLIKNMVIADLIFALTIMPETVVSMFYESDSWIGGIFGLITCKLVFYAVPVSITASVMTLTVISFDRFCAIFFPFSQAFFSKHKTITVIIWLTSLITMSPNLLLFQVFKKGDQYFCYPKWPWADDEEGTFHALRILHVIAFIFLYALPLLVMAVVNSLVARRVWFHKSPGNTSSFNKTSAAVTRRKVVKMLLTIVIVFALCWLPTYVSHYFMFFQKDFWDEIPIIAKTLMFWVSHANSAINPLLYIAFNRNFRYAFLDATVSMFASPVRAVSSCVTYILEERSTSHLQNTNPQLSRPRQQSRFRVAPDILGVRNGTGKTLDTRL